MEEITIYLGLNVLGVTVNPSKLNVDGDTSSHGLKVEGNTNIKGTLTVKNLIFPLMEQLVKS